MKSSSVRLPFASVLLAAALSSGLLAQENYATGWSGQKYVIVNTVLAGITAPVVKYPLLVRLDSTHAAIFTQAKAGGSDLRFVKLGTGTRLQHQVEAWDSSARRAAIWVLADTIPPNRGNHAIRLLWGNAAAADSSNGAKVFDTANHFQAVWHMAGSANETDATLNGFTATQNGSAAPVAAVVGAGRSVSSGNYFRAGGTASGKLNFPEGSFYTISAWVNSPTLPGHGTIVSKHDNAYALKLNAGSTSWEFFEFGSDATVAGWNWVNAPAEGDFGVWRHLVGVRSDFDVALYVNGVRMDGGFSTASSTAARVLNTDVVIGAQPTSNTAVQRAFDGTLDEVRMANAARSADWIKLDYETQKPGTPVVIVWDEIPIALRPGESSREAFTVSQSGKGLVFRVEATGAAGAAEAVMARVSVLDMRGLTLSSRVSALNNGVLAWDGRGAGGQFAPQGIYAVRITLMDSRGAVIRTVEAKVPLMR